MNANSQPLVPTSIKNWLDYAIRQLIVCDIHSANLDAELILSRELGVDRTYLHAHHDDLLDNKAVSKANKKLSQRLKRIPLAYICSQKEFYGRNFQVSTGTLIPRPESEQMIESLKELFTTGELNILNSLNLIDIGTGCGALGITAKLEFPTLQVTLTDISQPALNIATRNSKKLSSDVKIIQGDLLENYNHTPDVILANLPYVNPDWNYLKDIDHEPSLALYAGNDGKELIEKLLIQSSKQLNNNGFILIEADPCQHDSLIDYAAKLSLKKYSQIGYIISFKKVI